MKILVVEDNEDSRILLVKQLRAYGHEVMAAADGVEALQQALEETPDILIHSYILYYNTIIAYVVCLCQ